ncbi:2-keto-4-pentenoate hydratase [Pseudahrensia aquimaris]|uniref:2-keto-4-pentenoate hydratase n=1 Tax=Pseudahrensia aquimaris TaxID=744461 RepID=A0ABW3FFY5_9HYPH
MNSSEFATAIAEARRTGVQAHVELPDPKPTMAQALEHQKAVVAAFGSPHIGWKVGATNDGAQKAFGLDGPFYGPMVEASLVEEGGAIAARPTVMAVEPEYAFKMARDYPAAGEAINEETAADAVASCHIALEVIGRCVGSESFQNGIGLTVDFAGNSAFIVGSEIKDWQNADLVSAPVQGMSDGETVQEGSGANVMGAPLTSLVWMAKALADQGSSLKAGEWVSTGTCTAPVPAKAGTTVSASFGDFGTVSVKFT